MALPLRAVAKIKMLRWVSKSLNFHPQLQSLPLFKSLFFITFSFCTSSHSFLVKSAFFFFLLLLLFLCSSNNKYNLFFIVFLMVYSSNIQGLFHHNIVMAAHVIFVEDIQFLLNVHLCFKHNTSCEVSCWENTVGDQI